MHEIAKWIYLECADAMHMKSMRKNSTGISDVTIT